MYMPLLYSSVFVMQSLAQRVNKEKKEEEKEGEEEEGEDEEKEEVEDHLSYTLPGMIMEYLKRNVPLEEQKRCHLQLVQNYSEKCEGSFAELKGDGYIHQQLLMHVHEAGKMELLGQLLTNLLWMVTCYKRRQARNLLETYIWYQPFVPEEVRFDSI